MINDFLSGGLTELEHMSRNDVKDACTSYAKRTNSPFPIIMTILQKQRMKALILWVKDMVRAQVDVYFEDETTRSQSNAALKAAPDREQMTKDQRKGWKIFPKWEKFVGELDSTLAMIIGNQGLPLTYVIRENEEPHFDPNISYDKAIIHAAV